MIGEGFLRHEADGLVFFRCPAFDRIPGLRHGFSARGGRNGTLNLTPLGWDSRERVMDNRKRFLAAIGLSGTPLATISQTHSDIIQIFDPSANDLNGRREGDALAAGHPGIALGVQVADCFPILVADRETRAIAAVHSGWRGTASRILEKTANRLRDCFGSKAGSLMVAIGPGIRACCMQVGEEVAAGFERHYPRGAIARPEPGKEGKFLLDLPRALALQCEAAGIPAGQVFDLNACTRCRPEEFFSYRAEGAAAGRMMGVIGRL